MEKFAVYQSNKYITSLKLRSRRPTSGCDHSGQPARFETPPHGTPQTQRAPPHSLSHTSQCPSTQNSTSISNSARVSQWGIAGRFDRSSHFATSAFLSIASARNQSSSCDPPGQPLASHNWYATVAISLSVGLTVAAGFTGLLTRRAEVPASCPPPTTQCRQ